MPEARPTIPTPFPGWPTGPALRRLRDEHRVSQADLAEAMSTSSSHVSAIENHVGPSRRIVERYVAALDLLVERRARTADETEMAAPDLTSETADEGGHRGAVRSA